MMSRDRIDLDKSQRKEKKSGKEKKGRNKKLNQRENKYEMCRCTPLSAHCCAIL